jgi:hypothetical protein
MLTRKPKRGDRVIFVITPRASSRDPIVIKPLPVKSCGAKYITVQYNYSDFRFGLDGRIADSTAELWDNTEAYEDKLSKDRLISEINKVVTDYRFGNGKSIDALSIKTLEQVLSLLTKSK